MHYQYKSISSHTTSETVVDVHFYLKTNQNIYPANLYGKITPLIT